MIGYTTLGTNDLEKAKVFYDAVFAAFGAQRVYGTDRTQGWGIKGVPGMLSVCKPFDGGKATNGNGTMVALMAASREVVDKVHAAALSAGGTSEGAPGLRGDTFYAAYFRDLDGNKICTFKTGA